ncbi:hypothetical protein ES707_19688 [subsurface metagenome]
MASKEAADRMVITRIALTFAACRATSTPAAAISINPRAHQLVCDDRLVKAIISSAVPSPVNLTCGPAPGVGTNSTGKVKRPSPANLTLRTFWVTGLLSLGLVAGISSLSTGWGVSSPALYPLAAPIPAACVRSACIRELISALSF